MKSEYIYVKAVLPIFLARLFCNLNQVMSGFPPRSKKKSILTFTTALAVSKVKIHDSRQLGQPDIVGIGRVHCHEYIDIPQDLRAL